MTKAESNNQQNDIPIKYFAWWLYGFAAVSAALYFALAVNFGTFEFFNLAMISGLLLFVPLVVIVAGAQTLLFLIIKWVLKRKSSRRRVAFRWLLWPPFSVALLLCALGACKLLPRQRLAAVCGEAPASAREIRVAGYRAFLNGYWIATFKVDAPDFDKIVQHQHLTNAPNFDVEQVKRGFLKDTAVVRDLPQLSNSHCFSHVYQENGDRERGGIFAAFDPATSSAFVYRGYHD